MVDVLANLNAVRQRIRVAAERAGRLPSAVELVAVTKTISLPEIQLAVNDGGIKALGENRVQELLLKQAEIKNVGWHLIGPLQTNKARKILDKVVLIHSLDRWSLAQVISQVAVEKNLNVQALIEVNISGEVSKHGLAPLEVKDFIEEVSQLPGISLQGLMTMAPFVTNKEETRPIFRGLNQLCITMRKKWPNIKRLSMGMSNDFEVAIEEGADLVRVGSAIFKNEKDFKL